MFKLPCLHERGDQKTLHVPTLHNLRLYVSYNGMKLTLVRDSDDLSWYKFQLNNLGEQLVLDIGGDFVIEGKNYEILMIQYNKSGLSGLIVVQST